MNDRDRLYRLKAEYEAVMAGMSDKDDTAIAAEMERLAHKLGIDPADVFESKEQTMKKTVKEAVAKIGCTKCDAVSTEKAWKKNDGTCPKCNNSTQGVAESKGKKPYKGTKKNPIKLKGFGDNPDATPLRGNTKHLTKESQVTEAKSYRLNFEPSDYKKLRQASMRGKFSHNFSRDASGNITFKTTNPRKLARDLENIVDFGATSAFDVLDISPYGNPEHYESKEQVDELSPATLGSYAKKASKSAAGSAREAGKLGRANPRHRQVVKKTGKRLNYIDKAVDKMTKESQVTEGVLDDIDDDGFMAKRQLYDLAKHAVALHRMIQDTDDLEPWVQAKITKAADYIGTIQEYLEYEGARGAEDMAGEVGLDDIGDIETALEPQVADPIEETPEDSLDGWKILRMAEARGLISNEQYNDPGLELHTIAEDFAQSLGVLESIGNSDVTSFMREFAAELRNGNIMAQGRRAHMYESEDNARKIYNRMLKGLRG